MANLKEKAKELILAEKQKLGSLSAVAVKCDVSEATISLILNGKYEAEGDTIFIKIINVLGQADTAWNTVPTINATSIMKIAAEARKKSLFVAISEKAGSGKTASLKRYYAESTVGVYYIQCREWSKREMLRQFCKNLGIAIPTGYITNDELGELIFEYFSKRVRQKPQLIIDEADKLKPSALRFMIPLFNEHEDKLSVIIAGTENLEKEIKRGVSYAKKGYDEIDSRFGRNFIHLIGATFSDVKAICSANGIKDVATQKEIFEECGTVQKTVENRHISVVEDLRRLKRIVQRHQLQNQ